jgi:hypothetical protein
MRIALFVGGVISAALLYLAIMALGSADPHPTYGTIAGYERRLARRILKRMGWWLVGAALVCFVVAGSLWLTS